MLFEDSRYRYLYRLIRPVVLSCQDKYQDQIWVINDWEELAVETLVQVYTEDLQLFRQQWAVQHLFLPAFLKKIHSLWEEQIKL